MPEPQGQPNGHVEDINSDNDLPSWISVADPFDYHHIIDRGGFATVHKLGDKRTNEIFARKVIPIDGGTIQNEIRVIEALRRSGSHGNIVEVLRHGDLVYRSLYYIDMEFCDLTLKTYIYRTWTPEIERDMPYFTVTPPPRIAYAHLRNIMQDIASGLSYIHEQGQVHRDMKPANVLYSHRSFTWKIGDFGLTVEGSSNARTTVYSMGTPCYRAPELVRGVKKVFSNRVDVWALGCIFYELLYRMPAFDSDYATGIYSSTDALYVPQKAVDNLSEIISREEIMVVLKELLHNDPEKRPSAAMVRDEFRHTARLFQRRITTDCVEVRTIKKDFDFTAPSSQISPVSPVDETQNLVRSKTETFAFRSPSEDVPIRTRLLLRLWTFWSYITLTLLHISVIAVLVCYYSVLAVLCDRYIGRNVKGLSTITASLAVSVPLAAVAKGRPPGSVFVHFGGSILIEIGCIFFSWIFNDCASWNGIFLALYALVVVGAAILPLYLELLIL